MRKFAWRSAQFNGLLGACRPPKTASLYETLRDATEPLAGSDPPHSNASVALLEPRQAFRSVRSSDGQLPGTGSDGG
jgi:hypothetical protein